MPDAHDEIAGVIAPPPLIFASGLAGHRPLGGRCGRGLRAVRSLAAAQRWRLGRSRR